MANEIELVKEKMAEAVQERIDEYVNRGELAFPASYNAKNAVTAAWLIIQNVEDKNHKKALEVCDKGSVYLALLDMAIQGLNPVKKQCYFIVYGNRLTMQRSYFGTMELVREMAGAKNIYAQVVYSGDDFEYDIVHGIKQVTKHKQKLENIDSTKIIAAYCTIEFENANENVTEIMTIAQLKKAWAMSKTGQTVHNNFAEEMAKKTVINRACKPFINSSNDSNIVIQSARRTQKIITDSAIEAEIMENANTEQLEAPIEVQAHVIEQPKQEAPKQEKEHVAPQAQNKPQETTLNMDDPF